MQSHIIAFFGTLLSLCLVFLLLWLLTVKAPVLVEDEGIMVAFGNADEGGGTPDGSYIDEITQVEQIPAPSNPSRPSDNDLMVQEDEESLELQKQAEDAKRKAEEEALKRRRAEEEAQEEAERIAKEKILAEKKAKEQEAIENANQFAALFGQAGTTEGANGETEATNATSGMGNPSGKGYGSIDNATWTLQGRNCRHIPKPSEEFNQTGRVVVNIIVDLEGNVTSASIGDGSNISDRRTQRLALESARNAKFSKGETTQRGTIVYIFTDKKITK